MNKGALRANLMNSFLFYAAAIFIFVAILDKLPGTRYLADPILSWVVKLAENIFSEFYSWIIWFIKGIWKAHKHLARNLALSKEEIDPTASLKGKRLGISEDDGEG